MEKIHEDQRAREENQEKIQEEDILEGYNNEDGTEMELIINNRPRRECAGAGIERLKMSMDSDE